MATLNFVLLILLTLSCSINSSRIIERFGGRYRKDLNIAKESFAEGLLCYLMSHGIHPYVRQVLEYFLRTFHEIDLMAGALQTLDAFFLTPSPVHFYDLWERSNRMSTIQVMEECEEEWRQFTAADLRSTFRLLSFGMAGGGIICFLEFWENESRV